MKVAVLTVSDKGSRGERVDESGPYIRDKMLKIGAKIVAFEIVPDELDQIKDKLIHYADDVGADVVLTTGGTGLSPRDVTPEATLAVIDRRASGFTEAIRTESLKETPNAMLSRAESGLRGSTIIVNLSGSLRAVREQLDVLIPVLPHALEMLQGKEH